MKAVLILIILFISYSTICYGQVKDTLLLPEIEIQSTLTKPISAGNYWLQTKTDSAFWKNTTAEQQLNNWGIASKLYSPGGLATPSIRGMTASQTTFYWNGLLINSPLNGTIDLNQYYSWSSAQRLTLNKSTGLQWQGSSGPGGTIWSETIFPADKKNIFAAFLQSGSFKTFAGGINTNFKTGSVDHLFSSMYQQSANNYYYPNPNVGQDKFKRLTNADFSHLQFEYAANLGDKLRLIAYHHRHKTAIPLPVTSDGNGSYQDNAESRLALTYNQELKKIKLNLLSGLVRQNLNYYPVINQSSPINYSLWQFNLINSLVSGKILKHPINLSASEMLNISSNDSIGRHQEFDTRVTLHFQNPLKASGLIYGATGQFQHTDIYDPLSYRIYVGYLFSGTELLFAHATNQRIPTINDRYWPLSGNPELKTEYTQSFEFIGRRKFDHIGNIALSFFYNKVSDWIQWLPSGTNGLWKPQNIMEVKVKGIDLTSQLHWSRNDFRHEILGNVSISKPLISKDYSGRQGLIGKVLPYSPFVQTALAYSVGVINLNCKLSYQFISSRFSTSDNDSYYKLKSMHLLNVSLDYKFKLAKNSWNLGIELNNLFNQTYYSIPYRPLPRFNWEMTLGYQFQSSK